MPNRGFESLSHRFGGTRDHSPYLGLKTLKVDTAITTIRMSIGYMYILLCKNDSYYTGSTVDLEKRYQEHLAGEGAGHTKKHPPVGVAYVEEYQRIDLAFQREKQVQRWSRKKKQALINGEFDNLPELAKAYRDLKPPFDRFGENGP